ncbi:MAG: hypothetical protein JNK07_15880 [Alphaproteobacteria bacterium]|nr:hypothetical protein [Alphaproteobacteria bacterium]
MDVILQEMLAIVRSVFTTDSISLIIMLFVVVIAGMALGQMGRIVQVTVGALAMYGLLRLAYSVTQGVEPMSLPMNAWNGLKGMTVGDLVVWFLAFAIVISIVHLIRNAVAARGH